MNDVGIIDAFQSEFDDTWQSKEPLGLVSPFFPMTFNPSGGHDVARPAMLNPEPLDITKFYTVERCFRDIDVGIVGLSHHLSFFEMLTFGTIGNIRESLGAIQDIVNKTADLLLNVYQLDPGRIFVAYFSGGIIANRLVAPITENELSLWRQRFKLHLVPTTGRRTFIYAKMENWPAGPGFEIFYDRGSNLPETIRFLEIASINFYKFINKSNTLHESVNWAIGGGIGLERLSMALESVPTIYDIDSFRRLKETIYAEVGHQEILLFSKSYNILLDHLRSIAFIISDGQKIDSSSRGRILRKLINRAKGQISYLNLVGSSLLRVFYDTLIKSYGDRYPQLRQTMNSFFQVFEFTYEPQDF